MRFLLALVLASCGTPTLDFSGVAQLYRSDGGQGTATPVAYASDGFYVLTCWHVVRGGTGFVLFIDGMSYFDGVITWTDQDSDTALVGFTTKDRPKLYKLAMDSPRPYSHGYAAGYPLGVNFLIVGDVLFQGGGIINHLTGPGGSGGPVFDEHGLVCGISSKVRVPAVDPVGHALLGWIVKMSPLGSVSEKIDELNKH